jgi:hypothetical protein
LQQQLAHSKAEQARLIKELYMKLGPEDIRLFKDTVKAHLEAATMKITDLDLAYGLVVTEDMTDNEQKAVRIRRFHI